jgi:hypothetical protein
VAPIRRFVVRLASLRDRLANLTSNLAQAAVARPIGIAGDLARDLYHDRLAVRTGQLLGSLSARAVGYTLTVAYSNWHARLFPGLLPSNATLANFVRSALHDEVTERCSYR